MTEGHCIVDIGHWMAANGWQMTSVNTELLLAGSKHDILLLGNRTPALQLGSDTVTGMIMYASLELRSRRI